MAKNHRIVIEDFIDTARCTNILRQLQEVNEGDSLLIELRDCSGEFDECSRIAQAIGDFENIQINAIVSGIVISGAVLIAVACRKVHADAVSIIGDLTVNNRDESDILIDQIAKYRGIEFLRAFGLFEEGKLFTASEAKEIGLIDYVGVENV